MPATALQPTCGKPPFESTLRGAAWFWKMASSSISDCSCHAKCSSPLWGKALAVSKPAHRGKQPGGWDVPAMPVRTQGPALPGRDRNGPTSAMLQSRSSSSIARNFSSRSPRQSNSVLVIFVSKETAHRGEAPTAASSGTNGFASSGGCEMIASSRRDSNSTFSNTPAGMGTPRSARRRLISKTVSLFAIQRLVLRRCIPTPQPRLKVILHRNVTIAARL
mmetsp:Transcript_3745/g.9719  ORF Transcript_3745/g.9719 Transcript_3745/m.9719 type:complete len:220 (-) Transcript_3745:26-685(-)